jgi:pimeloyl-ACP methyl ester carboxylesterase
MRMHRLLEANAADDPWQVAEQIWRSCEENVDEFFATVPPQRIFRLRYEDLVTEPENQLRGLCDWLGLEFAPQMLDPYGPNRMTDGIAGDGSHVGDPNFFKRRSIDPNLAETWRRVVLPRPLAGPTTAIAHARGYSLAGDQVGEAEGFPAARRTAPKEVRWQLASGPLAGVAWDGASGSAVLCVHGYREQGLAFAPMAERLTRCGRSVLAPDLRGHGLSPHLGPDGCYSLRVFMRDLATLIDEIGEPPLLVGHSLGGALALLLAAARPEKLKGLCLLDVPLQPRSQPVTQRVEAMLSPTPPEHRLLAGGPAEAATRLCAATPDLSEELALSLATRLTERHDGHYRWRWDCRLSLPLDGLELIADPGELLLQVRASGLPVTAVYGDRSPLTHPADIKLLHAASIPVERVEAGHHPHLAAPDHVARAVLSLDEP